MGTRVLLSGSPEDIALLERALSRSRWDVAAEAATDGYRAVELAVRTKPDLIVVDPVTHGLWGAELVRRLRASAPAAPVVCWANSTAAHEVAALLRAGATGYVLKSEGPEAVVNAVGPVLEGGAVLSPAIAVRMVERFSGSIQRERELTRALGEATLRLQEVGHAKAEFLANVSHELRTPVTIVKGVAHLLKGRNLSPDDEIEFLDKLDRAVERLTNLVDEILSIADLDRAQMPFQPVPSDVSALVTEVGDRVAAKYPQATLRREIPERLTATVDPARIAEAIAQLLDNACRYSPQGGVVTVRLRIADEGMVFSVTDTGLGLSRQVAAQAFNEPFVTGEEILRKERAGVGLGLHLARRLVLLHGGIMWADPLPSGGTRVSFCIPQPVGEEGARPPGDAEKRGVIGRQATAGAFVFEAAPEDPPQPAQPEADTETPASTSS